MKRYDIEINCDKTNIFLNTPQREQGEFIKVDELRKLLEEKREYKKKLIADLPEDYDDWLYDYHELCGQVTSLTEALSLLEEKEVI